LKKQRIGYHRYFCFYKFCEILREPLQEPKAQTAEFLHIAKLTTGQKQKKLAKM